jgi:ferredoxin
VLAHAEEDSQAGDAYLWSSAAVESRDFPVFVYNEERGPRWGSRFDIALNPQPEQAWPRHELKAEDAEGQEISIPLAFTFADFAAQDPSFQDHFLLVPPAYWSEDLIPFVDYLSLSQQQAYGKVPFIWMVDAEGMLQKVAVAWPVVQTSLERQEFWQYLQESAGVHNYHVEVAVEQLRKEMEAQQAEAIAALQADHEAALAATAEKAAGDAMERLAAALLDLETASELVASVSQPVEKKEVVEKAPPVEPLDTAEEAAEAVEEEEELMLGEAYIDTPMCTTCNECINLNGSIFKYNEEKQAYIADPKGGPFRDIVRAAELCPAGIIHPGAPQHPDEPDLEALIKRAEPFNG